MGLFEWVNYIRIFLFISVNSQNRREDKFEDKFDKIQSKIFTLFLHCTLTSLIRPIHILTFYALIMNNTFL